jgi:hypothetical protein
MPDPQQTYTYRAGRKIPLEKQPDQFVARALPDELAGIGIEDAEQVSSASSRVATRVADLEPLMDRSRHLAPTHHAYTRRIRDRSSLSPIGCSSTSKSPYRTNKSTNSPRGTL